MLLLLCALMAGSVSVWATEVTYTISSKNTLSTSGTAPTGSSASIAETYSTSCQMTGENSQTLTLKGYKGYKITKLVLSMKSNKSSGAGKLSYSVDGGTNYTYLVGTGTSSTGVAFSNSAWYGSWTTSYQNVTKDNLTIECGESDVIFKIEATANSLYCQSYAITYEANGPQDLTSFAFANETPSVQLSKNGLTWEASYTQTVSFAPAEYTGTIGYAIDEDNSTIPSGWLVDVDEDGEVTILADTNEDATIKVKASGAAVDGKFNAPADAIYTLTVDAAPAGVGTPEFDTASGSYYYGTVVKITSMNADKIYYTTDGTTPSSTNGTLYNHTTGVVIDKTMTLKAIGYDGETPGEVASINYTLLAPEAPTFSVTGDVTAGTTVTLTAGEGGEMVVYTTDGSDPTIASEIYTAPIAINYAQTIKAATVDDGDNLSSVASADYAIVIVNSGTLWEEDFTGYKQLDVPSSTTYSYTCVNGNAATCIYTADLAGGESPELLINKQGGSFSATIPLDNIEGDLTLTFKVNNPLTVSTTTKNVTLSGNTTAAKGDNTVTITGVTASMTALNITFSNSTSSNVRIDNIVLSYSNTIRTEKVVVTAAEYATYYSAANALDFSGTGITVYTATDNETSVSLNEVTSGKVPAGTAVVLYKEGADGTPVNVPVATSAAAVEGTNDLHVVGEGGLTGEDNIYVLAKKNDKVGFYLWDKTATLNEGKIYLQGKATYGAREFLGFDDNGTTSINEELGMKNDEFANAPVFNLNGQRVSQPTKGLYIVDGRKVVKH